MFIFRHNDVIRMKSDRKGKNTKKSWGGFSWAKAFLVMGCILFVGVMIISSLGSNWLASLKPTQSGDIAYADVTLKDELGRTVFTTNQRIYNATLEKGTVAWQASPMTIKVNNTTRNLIEPIPAYLPATGEVSFAFLGPEYNQIAAGLVGMKEGETKHISFIQNPSFQQELNQEQFAQMGGNFTMAQEGGLTIFGFTTSPMISADNTTPQYALRTVTLKNKTSTNITVNYGYSGADVTILKLSRSS
jgi:hypothetical protein